MRLYKKDQKCDFGEFNSPKLIEFGELYSPNLIEFGELKNKNYLCLKI